MSRKTVKLIHKGKYVAEVPVELIENEGGWSPYLSLEDRQKARIAERDVAAAAKHGRVFELTPVSA